jgi:glutathione synthase/RimK-type ligase-like ATP-grasp enzyme
MARRLGILFEHPDWQIPLFSALSARSVDFIPIDLKRAAFDPDAMPDCDLYFNQASPSAYVRGNPRAVPLAMGLIRALEIRGARVLNGSRAFALELSKSAQCALMTQLGIAHPRSLAFNDVEAALDIWTTWPALVKPEQGGSGARMYLVESADDVRLLFANVPDLWNPDGLMLLQQKYEVDPSFGIVRLEYVGQEYLYAMRVVSHGGFNLCPSEVCHPGMGGGSTVEFFAYPEVPVRAIEIGQRLMVEGGLDVGGIEYLPGPDGEPIFYDVNANSNLRPAVAAEFGFDPFDRVAAYVERELAKR